MITDWLMRDDAAPYDGPPLIKYLGATRSSELMMPFCEHCNHPLDIDQVRCDVCGDGRASWRAVALDATVLTAIWMHRIEKGLVQAADPYPVAELELGSGHRLVASTAQRSGAALRPGQRVQLELVPVGQQYVPRIQV